MDHTIYCAVMKLMTFSSALKCHILCLLCACVCKWVVVPSISENLWKFFCGCRAFHRLLCRPVISDWTPWYWNLRAPRGTYNLFQDCLVFQLNLQKRTPNLAKNIIFPPLLSPDTHPCSTLLSFGNHAAKYFIIPIFNIETQSHWISLKVIVF